jgi:glutathione S-transferase
MKLSEDDKNRWYRHWVETGLEVVERQLAAQPATFCHGDTPTLADCTWCRRSSTPSASTAGSTMCRNVMRVFEACMKLDAFENTRPEPARMPPDAAAWPPRLGGATVAVRADEHAPGRRQRGAVRQR